MSYRHFVLELVDMLESVTYDSEIDAQENNNVPWGVYNHGALVGCLVCNNWLSGGVFVSVIDTRDTSIPPVLYGYSADLPGTEDILPLWALGLHLKQQNVPLSDAEHYAYQFYRVDSVIARQSPTTHSENDTLYAYLNGVPFLRVVRGKTPVFFFRPDIVTYHSRFADVTESDMAVWVPYLGEVMRLGLAPAATVDQVYSYLKVIQAMGQLMEVPMDYSAR